jgi:hypothetical protein
VARRTSRRVEMKRRAVLNDSLKYSKSCGGI